MKYGTSATTMDTVLRIDYTITGTRNLGGQALVGKWNSRITRYQWNQLALYGVQSDALGEVAIESTYPSVDSMEKITVMEKMWDECCD